ncbi:unnamed protein product [Cyprideis torosa]|uniref:Uncharacterized protein n=1 Tax=Cyprideis torosa TaxID=163714 RepID=A0A7R8W600_9CRUS|nr:unnamed protein product [Cyprideis torosa]CAG0885938.1 unnamed protein product [Cyprideis torosa]
MGRSETGSIEAPEVAATYGSTGTTQLTVDSQSEVEVAPIHVQWFKPGDLHIIMSLTVFLVLVGYAGYLSAEPSVYRRARTDGTLAVRTQITNPVQPVTIEVSFESLCPDSRTFIVNELFPLWLEAPQYLKIHFMPYGKAHLGYIHCLMTEYYINSFAKCSKYFGFDVEDIESCAAGQPEGINLLLQHGDATKALFPTFPKYFVPSIRINGVHYKNAHRNLKRYVCDELRSTALQQPAFCQLQRLTRRRL